MIHDASGKSDDGYVLQVGKHEHGTRQDGYHDVCNGVDAIPTALSKGISFTFFPLPLDQQFFLKGKLS